MTKPSPAPRLDGRKADELRPVSFAVGFAQNAAGSALVRVGRTSVLCAATVENAVPRWMRQQNVEGGWLTSEYSLLPYATQTRTSREATLGKVGGRTQEIQRLVGRSLRAVTDLNQLGTRTVWIDCDVIDADGGTRTAAITGAFVAYRIAIDRLLKDGALKEDPIREAVAAVSVGVVDGEPLLDLCYEEDARAEVDMNVVMTASGELVEVQGSAEKKPFSKSRLKTLLELAEGGVEKLLAAQQGVLKGET